MQTEIDYKFVCAGPIASFLILKTSLKTVMIAGGFFMMLGFACSAFVESLEMLYVTHGIIAGFTLFLVYFLFRIMLLKSLKILVLRS